MQPLKHTAYPSWFYGPLGGVVVAVGLTFAYALVFVVYAIIRSSLLLGSVASDAGLGGTLVAYAASLVVVFHVLLQRALGFSMSDVVSNLETYLLWLGFPSLIYLAAGGVASRQLCLRRKENP